MIKAKYETIKKAADELMRLSIALRNKHGEMTVESRLADAGALAMNTIANGNWEDELEWTASAAENALLSKEVDKPVTEFEIFKK